MIYNATHINVDCIICNNSSMYNFSKIFITKNTSSHVVFFHIQGQLLYTAKFEPYMLTTSYCTVYIRRYSNTFSIQKYPWQPSAMAR